jgi:4-hydroxybenzoate polyprenyltransferase
MLKQLHGVAWGALMASHRSAIPTKSMVVPISAYALGAILLRSAACVWNDICDIDIDRAVGKHSYRDTEDPILSRRNYAQRGPKLDPWLQERSPKQELTST